MPRRVPCLEVADVLSSFESVLWHGIRLCLVQSAAESIGGESAYAAAYKIFYMKSVKRQPDYSR